MRYILAAILALFQALTGQTQTATDINGTWTAELRSAKVFLQVRTAPPAEWNGDRWGGDWSTGQTLAVDEFAGLPANDERLSAEQIKFELHREAGTLAFQGSFRDGRGRRPLHLRAARAIHRRDEGDRLHRRPAALAALSARAARRRPEIHRRDEGRRLPLADARPGAAREDARRHRRVRQGDESRGLYRRGDRGHRAYTRSRRDRRTT